MQAVHLAAKVLIFRIIRYRPKLGLQSVRTSLHAGVLAAGSGQRADRVDSPLTCGPETQEAVTTVYVCSSRRRRRRSRRRRQPNQQLTPETGAEHSESDICTVLPTNTLSSYR